MGALFYYGTSCRPSGACNFKVASRVLDELWTPVVDYGLLLCGAA